LDDAVGESVDGSEQDVDHTDRGSTAEEGDEQAPERSTEPGRVPTQHRRDDLEHVDGEPYHNGDGEGDAEELQERTPAEPNGRSAPDLGPEPCGGVSSRRSEVIGDLAERRGGDRRGPLAEQPPQGGKTAAGQRGHDAHAATAQWVSSAMP
jgi:hypothetical protein